MYPLSALLAALLYQGTDPAIYYLIGIAVYFWAYTEGEVRLVFDCLAYII
jgi:TDG/mug DNA glycosylase family protein